MFTNAIKKCFKIHQRDAKSTANASVPHSIFHYFKKYSATYIREPSAHLIFSHKKSLESSLGRDGFNYGCNVPYKPNCPNDNFAKVKIYLLCLSVSRMPLVPECGTKRLVLSYVVPL